MWSIRNITNWSPRAVSVSYVVPTGITFTPVTSVTALGTAAINITYVGTVAFAEIGEKPLGPSHKKWGVLITLNETMWVFRFDDGGGALDVTINADLSVTFSSPTGDISQLSNFATTTSRLAITMVGSTIWLAGRDSTSSIWTATTTISDKTWRQRAITDSAADGPALAEFEGNLLLIARGTGDDETFWATSRTTTPPAHGEMPWRAPEQIPSLRSFVGPALARFNGKLIAVFRGAGEAQDLFYANFDGRQWTPATAIPGAVSPIGPGIAVFQNRLYAIWVSASGDQALWFASFDGTSWTPPTQATGMGSSVGPSLAVFKDKLYAAWRGAGSDEGIWWSIFDGTKWAPQTQVKDVGSSVGPAIAADQTNLYMAWRGAGPDDTVWWTSYDGQTWQPQQHISLYSDIGS